MTYAKAYTLLDSHHVDHVRVRVYPFQSPSWECDVYGTAQLEYLAAAQGRDGESYIELVEDAS